MLRWVWGGFGFGFVRSCLLSRECGCVRVPAPAAISRSTNDDLKIQKRQRGSRLSRLTVGTFDTSLASSFSSLATSPSFESLPFSPVRTVLVQKHQLSVGFLPVFTLRRQLSQGWPLQTRHTGHHFDCCHASSSLGRPWKAFRLEAPSHPCDCCKLWKHHREVRCRKRHLSTVTPGPLWDHSMCGGAGKRQTPDACSDSLPRGLDAESFDVLAFR